ncbi:MAG: phosphatase PAP2 family protein [Gammaproteobacteria bacterium]|nr:MAG: phosphatase PAP2 family protein [Gammaproteobacteria bacterium]
MSFKDRVIHMLWSWCTVGFVYGTTRFTPGARWIIPETWVDALIPFSTQGIWLYLSFFLFVPWAFLHAHENRILILRYAIQVSAIVSGIVFITFPSSLNYPAIVTEDISSKIFQILLMIDTTQNCLPSLHAALTLLALMSLWSWQKKLQSCVYLAIALLIGFSIIQLRRHLLIDVTAGLCVGLIAQLVVKNLRIRTILKGVRNNE